jgi:hypothetical protein
MEHSFDAIICATIRQAKAGGHLLWADRIAGRIAAATPLPVDRKLLVDQLAAAAVHEGIAVSFGRDNAPVTGESERAACR